MEGVRAKDDAAHGGVIGIDSARIVVAVPAMRPLDGCGLHREGSVLE